MQLENQQNDPVLLLHSALRLLPKRRPLRLLCYTKGRRTAFAAACFSHACLKAPEARLHISYSYGSQQGFSRCLQDTQMSSQLKVTAVSVPCVSFNLTTQNLSLTMPRILQIPPSCVSLFTTWTRKQQGACQGCYPWELHCWKVTK